MRFYFLNKSQRSLLQNIEETRFEKNQKAAKNIEIGHHLPLQSAVGLMRFGMFEL